MKRRKGFNYRVLLAVMNHDALNALPPLDATAATLWDATCGPTLTAGASEGAGGRDTPQGQRASGRVAVEVLPPTATNYGPFAPGRTV